MGGKGGRGRVLAETFILSETARNSRKGVSAQAADRVAKRLALQERSGAQIDSKSRDQQRIRHTADIYGEER